MSSAPSRESVLDRAFPSTETVLGFELMTLIPGATAFVSAGGYRQPSGLRRLARGGRSPRSGGRVGLRHWTVALEDPGEVAAVRERVLAAGAEAEEREGGFLARDPRDMAARFATPDGHSVRVHNVG